MPSKEKLEALKKKMKGEDPIIRPNIMDAHVNEKVDVTLGDLRAAVEAAPDHPFANAFRKACGDLKGLTPLPDARKVVVDKVDLQAILEGGEVDAIREADKDGNPVVRKVFVPPKTPASAPKTETGKKTGGSK